uniref:Reverse transcriptase domain-containing protein n=1 Tax=Xenopus tropicalis TaxID=8364 RepID=A0A803KEP9_XENTR
MADIKIGSMNARGLNTPLKRYNLLKEMRRLKLQVMLIQETHFKKTKVPTLRFKGFSTVHISTPYISKSRGTMILLADTLGFTLTESKTDTAGRFNIIKGLINNTKYTIASVYLPPTEQHSALSATLQALSEIEEGTLIVGGDLNVALEPILDTSTGHSSMPYKKIESLKKMLRTHTLIDTWRLTNPTSRNYSFYSPVHDVYSRIDYIFIRHTDIALLKEADIDVISWSDHAPITCTLINKTPSLKRSTWRLNDSLLRDQQIKQDIIHKVKQYFTENNTDNINPWTLWLAHKCVIRGELIKIGSRLKAERNAKVQQLLTKIHTLETQHKLSKLAHVLESLTEARKELRDTYSSYLARAIEINKKLFFEHGNKCGRLLASALKKKQLQNHITQLKTPTGQMVTTTKDIAEIFRQYYIKLYQLPTNTQRSHDRLHACKAYIHKTNIPKLSLEQQTLLDTPITKEEILLAIKSSKSGKAPGPDGFTIAYYKELGEHLTIHLTSAINSTADGNEIPQEAHISLIPKKGKDPFDPGSFRPISLLNVDTKLYTKVLATRINQILPELIFPEQVGFVPGREARDNTNRLFSIIQYAKKLKIPIMLLSTDAEKAFDRVDWTFLKATLQETNLGPKMIKRISALYTLPTAKLRVNGELSETFHIKNGTRQGCPLSPLLFILSLESFLRKIRDNPNISGIKIDTREHKTAAYADDLLFFIRNPRITLPNLLLELQEFQKISHFKINLTKSVALNISLPPTDFKDIMQNFPIKPSHSHLTYLGIKIFPELKQTVDRNYTDLINAFKVALHTWARPTISWVGRVNVLKMNILPRFLYLSQTIPYPPPQKTFQNLNTLTNKFIWANKNPRIARIKLSATKNKGGLGLPNWEAYHKSAILTRCLDWSFHRHTKLWIRIEQESLVTPLWASLWLPNTKREYTDKSDSKLKYTLNIWDTLTNTGKWQNTPTPLTPVFGNPDFPPD